MGLKGKLAKKKPQSVQSTSVRLGGDLHSKQQSKHFNMKDIFFPSALASRPIIKTNSFNVNRKLL